METKENYLEALITKTPQENGESAITKACKHVTAIKTEPGLRKQLQPGYVRDAVRLISSAHIVFTEFKTIAEAINYWKK